MVVMSVDDIWNEIYTFHHLKRCQLEEGKTLPIIKISIDVSSKEVLLIINEVEGNTISKNTFYPNILTSPTYLCSKV